MSMRPCWVEIDTQALEENYRLLRALAGTPAECLAIVKADAYGHGLELCAPAAVRAGARWIGVTSVEEAVAARAACPTARILVMAGVFPGQAEAVLTHRLTPIVWDSVHLDSLEEVARAAALPAASLPVHLEIDTGMSRQGVSLEQLPALLTRFADSPLRIEAFMTHLYASDETSSAATGSQLAQLEEALALCSTAYPASAPHPEFLSVGASAALLGGEAPELAALGERWNLRPMLRVGLALFGITPRFEPPYPPAQEPSVLARARERLRPVLTWKTRVATLRSIPAGTAIGYNGTFIATEPMQIALLAVGYADGLDRRLGNRFHLLIRGRRAPLVGRISMDQAVLDVTGIPNVQPGDEVVLIGTQESQSLSVFEHAEAAGTIPWEVFTRIACRVPRLAVPTPAATPPSHPGPL